MQKLNSSQLSPLKKLEGAAMFERLSKYATCFCFGMNMCPRSDITDVEAYFLCTRAKNDPIHASRQSEATTKFSRSLNKNLVNFT